MSYVVLFMCMLGSIKYQGMESVTRLSLRRDEDGSKKICYQLCLAFALQIVLMSWKGGRGVSFYLPYCRRGLEALVVFTA